MAEHSVVGVYKSLDEAEQAVRALGSGGFPIQKVSIIAKDLQDSRRVHGYVTAGDVALLGRDGRLDGRHLRPARGSRFLVGARSRSTGSGWLPGVDVAGRDRRRGGRRGRDWRARLVDVPGISKDKILKYEEA